MLTCLGTMVSWCEKLEGGFMVAVDLKAVASPLFVIIMCLYCVAILDFVSLFEQMLPLNASLFVASFLLGLMLS